MSAGRSLAARAANARWQVRRRRLMKTGQWQPFVDSGPVREHLRRINEAGMPYMAIAERLGLAQNTSLQHLMWGRGAYGPSHQVRRETAELVMAYWPSLGDFPDAARIDATGTRRRVQALAVRGWSRRLVAEKAGFRGEHFRKAISRDRVTARLARQVAAVYDAWWDQDPLQHGVPTSSVTRVLRDATQAGWHGPLAWDDDTIDDPAAVAQVDAVAPGPEADAETAAARWLNGESVVLGARARRLVIRHLMEWTADPVEAIAGRLGIEPESVSRSWERIKKRERDAGRRAPWRRVYLSAADLGLESSESSEMQTAA